MKHLIIILIAISITNFAYSQDWYKNLKNEHNKYRYGVSLMGAEPTGVAISAFKGFFCSNNNSYAASIIWELYAGIENSINSKNLTYREGEWQNGGLQYGFIGFIPIITLEGSSISFQTTAGIGLQFGQRKYKTFEVNKSDNSSGFNTSIRAELTPHGITMGDKLFFLVYYIELRYHNQFGESFNYLKPGFGIAARMVR